MQHFLKNLDYATALPLAAQVAYQPGQIASKKLVQNAAVGMTLFAFDKGEEISAHTSTGDAFVLALDGRGQVSISGQTTPLEAGEAIVMPAGQPHSVSAPERFKWLLVVVFPTEMQ
ncbi:MAG: cupin domain-containing protein [Desulfovibrio sp.]|nr:cupin domain-containing protein [Desulfovibrio sp.]